LLRRGLLVVRACLGIILQSMIDSSLQLKRHGHQSPTMDDSLHFDCCGTICEDTLDLITRPQFISHQPDCSVLPCSIVRSEHCCRIDLRGTKGKLWQMVHLTLFLHSKSGQEHWIVTTVRTFQNLPMETRYLGQICL